MTIPAPATTKSRWRQVWFVAARGVRRLLHLSDTPHRIALGSAAGLFVMPLPIPGQMLLGPLLAKLVRGNVLASIPWTWVNNPFTVLFFLYGQYRLGLLVTPGQGTPVSFGRLDELVDQFQHLPWREAMDKGTVMLGEVLVPLAVGTVLGAVVAAVVGYLAIRRLVDLAQRRKRARHATWRRDEPSGGAGVGDSTRDVS
jgi:uncharacterized protein (DUF2062 family)